ncbi:uncharacterized protein LOC107272394 isoform X2 [Cephus cinctus]|uniref:Uncharacterized protein LOC107272394 isoform X2 n=1 Tax=Cephus cinctus TaxID=211228 RepID=A0AAJ7C9C8_CEPCN|nr:uncharacterized protein LOC107272394 isoform X2 [Cephus cinctus]
MSGRLPRLRALRPRPQPHLQNTPAPTRTESRYNKEEEEEINDEEDELLVENEEDIEGGVDEEEEEEDEIIDEQELEEQESVNDDRFKSDESEKRLVIKEEPVEIVTEEPEDSERNYECKTCNPPKGLSNLKAYLAHLKNEHKQKVKCYECPHCEFVCQHVKKLQRHFRVAHEDLQDKVAAESAERSRCPMCAHIAANPQDLETHQRVHHLKRRFFRCAKCSYVTHVRARYTKHVKYHSMPMIKCDACDFRTPYKWNLDRHTRNHGGGGAFQCRACNFTADIRQSLTVHETNHHEPPVGRTPRKMNTPFERKPRNSPKRYNQVGASDFRDTATGSNHPEKLKSGSPAKSLSPDKNLSSPEDRRSAIAGAECIALKCEEKGCQFITAWDSKMQRHLAESHSQNAANKPKKPLPMLIPLSPVSNAKANNAGASGPGTTLLKVPRVRVRPELARIARDTEMARLYGNKEVRSLDHQKIASELKKEAGTTDSFEKKNASFFDKLKERLMTTSGNNGIAEVAVSSQNDLKCWCTFEASSLEELTSHRRTHHTALSVSLGTSRCPNCRRRCKSSADLQVHMRLCHPTSNDYAATDNSLENSTGYTELRTAYRGEYAFPFQVDWDANFGALNSSGSSVEGGSTPSGRRVFKCPHCPFWASTASRFHVHIVGHLNRKPFECSLCAYRSNWRWDITKHIKLKAARDPAHMCARVLMTDETGRRNYSKYNKYLAQIEQQSGDERIYGERTGEDRTSDEPPTKILIMSDTKEYPQPPELTPAPVSLLTSTNSSREISALPLRPPPPLKAATRSQGQSLLKNNPAVSNANATVTPTTGVNASLSTTAAVTALAITPVTAMAPSRSSPPGSGSEESKRTLWKCKRCNFRDSNKETVLIHVKSHYESMDDVAESEKNAFTCEDCPFSAADAESLALHRVHHRPNLEAIFKCYLCPYYVSTKVELLDHARLHGEELAVVHQRNVESESPPSKRKYSQNHRTVLANNQTKEESSMEQVIHITSPSTSTSGSVSSKGNEAPPLLLDTRALPDAPLVWVSRTDGTIAKMLKCRHCPHVSSRRAEVRDHESMHMNSPNQGSLIACPSCSFACSRREVMDSHAEMHSGALGTVHCLVDEGRTDAQQLNDLSTLLGLPQPISVASEPDLRDSRLVHCCSKCPARFLCEKELRIHLRYHCTELAYSCQWCSYAARQPAHLLAHQKAHSPEYQDRTRYLLSLYGHSQRYPPPTTACVEANTQDSAEGNTTNVAWIVVEVGAGRSNVLTNHLTTSSQETGNQVFTCAKCPARYFKLDALEYHMTLHGTNNRFKCTECDYSSKTAQNLVKHQVVHRRHAEANENVTSSRLLPPPDPQFGILMRGNPNFVYPGYLRNGRLREKRYKCHKCPSAFEKREQYRIHLTLHGAKQRYRCDTCDYSVKYYANYAQHLRKHQANAQAQASRRRYEDDAITIDTGIQSDSTISISRSGKSLTKSSAGFSAAGNILASGSASNSAVLQVSNQDKQSLMLLQKKGVLVAPSEVEAENIRCQDCPFSTPDKDVMDAHKRRHGIERMTPPCPHCDYVPRKDENVGDHIRLHFTRLYKPDSYLIAELLTLTMRRVPANGKEDAKENELLFKECGDGRFLPIVDPTTSSRSLSPNENSVQEKVIVDPNTGEAKHHLTV